MQIHIGHKWLGSDLRTSIYTLRTHTVHVLLNMMHWLAHSLTHLNTHTSQTFTPQISVIQVHILVHSLG